MRRRLPWPWLIAGLLVLGGGCQNMDRLPTANPISRRLPAPVPPDELPGGLIPVSFRIVPALHPDPTTYLGTQVSLARAAYLDAPHPAASLGPVLCSAQQDRSNPCVLLERSAPLPLVVVPAARSICAHATDYRWLVGSLEFDRHNRWSVRYASDPHDLYKGVLELVNPGPMTGFCRGQLVRVTGELVDPAPLEIKPGYRIFSLQVLRR